MEKKDLKVESVLKESPVVEKQFVESMRLTEEQVLALPKVICRLEKVTTKAGRNIYYLTVRFDGKFDNHFKKQAMIEEAQFNHFIRKRKVDAKKGTYVVELPIRFIKGIGKNNLEYFSYQVFLSTKIAVNVFLKYFDREELDDIGYLIDWEVRNEQVDVEVDVEW